ncbi:MAG: aminodeoxychorismate synthase component I [Rhodothermales bacterium]
MTPTALRTVLSQPGTILLDASEAQRPEEGKTLLFASPLEILVASTSDAIWTVLARVDAAIAEGYYAAGFISYEAAQAMEPTLPAHPPDTPLCWFGIYTEAVDVSLDVLAETLTTDAAVHLTTAPTFGLNRPTYRERIDRIKSLIYEGEVYQINFTDTLTFEYYGEAFALYAALRKQQTVPFGAWLNIGTQQILSFSPELFFARDVRRIWTRPMKGTIHRGHNAHDDEALAEALRTDAKSQAENLMIVDLLRNDLSLVCEPGSVQVPTLFEVEPYRTLHQMTSTVEGRLVEGVSYSDVFAALFPCGSVTGAPKLRAMKHIHALERHARGVYCGTIGYIAPNDRAVFSVGIRTLTVEKSLAQMGVGSGIVWDSDADAEYDECLLKAAFITRALAPPLPPETGLIETMRVNQGTIELLDYHVNRLAQSAEALGFSLDLDTVHTAIRKRLTQTDNPTYVLRFVLRRSGEFAFSTRSVSVFERPLRLMLVQTDLDPLDPRLRHKTTARELYSQAYTQAQNAGYDEALLINAEGFATEGSRSNLFARFGDTWHTPPTALGLLGGVYRQFWLDSDASATEHKIHYHELAQADEVVLTNAVWRRVPCIVAPHLTALRAA